MEQPQMVRELYHTYLMLEPAENADVYGLRILQNNVFRFLLPFELRSSDCTKHYYYELPSKHCLKKSLDGGLGAGTLEAFAASLLGALDELHEYLLDEKDLLLSEDYIFQNPEGGYRFVYYPGYRKELSVQLNELGALFLKKADYTSGEAVRRVYEFYHKAGGEGGSVKSLREFVFSGSKAGSGATGGTEEKLSLQDDGKTPETQARAPDITMTAPDGEGGCGPDREFFADDVGETKTADKDVQTEASRSSRTLWIAAGAACVCELGCAAVCMKLFPGISRLWLIAGAAAAILLTGAGAAAAAVLKRRRGEEKDFWGPEDYVSCSWGRDTTVLHATALLKERPPGICLKSRHPGLCGDLNITVFPAIIGKEAADSRCRIPIPTVSRRHARLEYGEKGFCLTDLHSSNGTFINGELIPPMKSAPVKPGDSVIFSDVEFIFEQPEGKE